ncbi:hypothetical protein Dda_6808 [Drechslerella dactyloides]|uniref:F-box domain-containing protein n=1 Tax=Drechslerella dactyloides TaxID=74499 RepID=A0AAD6IU88_DREDA|nr:hypothetical protein Dda_6808 [Drechslerella dactyloides]
MDPLSSLCLDIFLLICDYLPESDFLRLKDVSSRLRRAVYQTSRLQRIHSKKTFFMTVDGLDKLISLCHCASIAPMVRHLVLDVCSPRFSFNVRRNIAISDIRGSRGSPDEGILPDPPRDDCPGFRSSGNNTCLTARLEQAFRKLSNVRTIEFAGMYVKSYMLPALSPTERESVFNVWERHNPVLQGVPNWKIMFLNKDLYPVFEPLYTECDLATIYADTLFCAVKAKLKLVEITMQPHLKLCLDHGTWGTELSKFHGSGISDPEKWVGAYAEVFSDLRVLHLHLNFPIPAPNEDVRASPVSPVFVPMVKSVEELHITQTGCPWSPNWRLPLPKDLPLPKLRSLDIKLGPATLDDMAAFIIQYKATLNTLTLEQDEFLGPSVTVQDLVDFLRTIHAEMSLTGLYLKLTVHPRQVIDRRGVVVCGVGYRRKNLATYVGILADGNWREESSHPFKFATQQHAIPERVFRPLVEAADPTDWSSLIHGIENMYELP